MTICTNNTDTDAGTRAWSRRSLRPLHDGDGAIERRDRREWATNHATQIVRVASPDQPLLLESGAVLDEVDVAFETIGRLNAAADNAVIVCHPL